MKLLICLCLVALSFSGVFAQRERFVRPVDEARKDASFYAFRTNLIAAAKKRDLKYVLSIVDPDIKASFGDANGIEDFKEMWKIESSETKFWDEFLPVLTGGGTFYKEKNVRTNEFWAPYTFTSFPADLDSFDYSAIFGNNVNLREAADLRAKVVTRLSYNVVKVDFENSVKENSEDEGYSWLKVETLGGKRGFVKSEFVRSPIDYRAGFEKKKGRWKMTAFIAGD